MKNQIYKCQGTLLRVLQEKDREVIVIDCIKRTMPQWMPVSVLQNGTQVTEEEMWEMTAVKLPGNLTQKCKKVMRQRFTMITAILPFIGEKRQRSLLIAKTARNYGVSENTIKNYLCRYLV